MPDFVLQPDPPEGTFPGYWLALQTWLNARGLWFLEMQLPPGQPWMPLPFASLAIFFGETKRGVRHAVIGRCHLSGFEAIFNPWPEAEFGDGVAALGFILPADPATYIRLGMALSRVEKLASAQSGPLVNSIYDTARAALGTEKPFIFLPNGERA